MISNCVLGLREQPYDFKLVFWELWKLSYDFRSVFWGFGVYLMISNLCVGTLELLLPYLSIYIYIYIYIYGERDARVDFVCYVTASSLPRTPST